MAIGQISGQLLSQDLLRNGVNLSFDTDLVFLDVINRKVGVNTNVPSWELDVNGLLHTTNINIDSQWTVGNVTGSIQNNITTTVGKLNIGTDNTVITNRLISGNIQVKTNVVGLSTAISSGNLYINPSSAQTNIGTALNNNNVLVNGSLHATGDITADGNIILGNDQGTDTINIQAQITSDLIPKTDITYDIGSSSLRWNNFNVYGLTATGINSTSVTSDLRTDIGNLSIQSNTITSLDVDGDINISPRSGLTVAENILFLGNEITQNTTSQNLLFNSVGTGYYQITGGLSGVQLPFGSTAQQPASAQLGQLRLNTDLNYLEVYNGTFWQNAIGPQGAASIQQVESEAVIWQLVLD